MDNYCTGTVSNKFDAIIDRNVYEKHNINIVAKIKECHVIIANKLDCEILHSKKMIIICERYDSTSIGSSPNDYSHKKVIAIFKDFLPRDTKLLLADTVSKRYHYGLLKRIYGTDTPFDKPRTDKQKYINKFKQVSWGLPQYSHLPINKHMVYCNEHKNNEKNIDVFCICHDHDDKKELAMHRKDIKEKLHLITNDGHKVITGEGYGAREFHDALLQSKICVSPWGIGERIATDQKAILSGCVLVKPDCDFVKTFPDLYHAANYVACKQDLSDLVEICLDILKNYDKYLLRTRNAQALLHNTTRKEYINNFCSKVKEVYEEHTKK